MLALSSMGGGFCAGCGSCKECALGSLLPLPPSPACCCRYSDVLPYNHSRVRLRSVPPGGRDYVNASRLTGPAAAAAAAQQQQQQQQQEEQQGAAGGGGGASSDVAWDYIAAQVSSLYLVGSADIQQPQALRASPPLSPYLLSQSPPPFSRHSSTRCSRPPRRAHWTTRATPFGSSSLSSAARRWSCSPTAWSATCASEAAGGQPARPAGRGLAVFWGEGRRRAVWLGAHPARERHMLSACAMRHAYLPASRLVFWLSTHFCRPRAGARATSPRSPPPKSASGALP